MKLIDILSFDTSEITLEEIKEHLKKYVIHNETHKQLDFALPENAYVIEKFEYCFSVNDFIEELQ